MAWGTDSDEEYNKRAVEVRQLPHEFESKLFRMLEEINKKLHIMAVDIRELTQKEK